VNYRFALLLLRVNLEQFCVDDDDDNNVDDIPPGLSIPDIVRGK